MAANGYSTVGDLHQTVDGKDWSAIWSEFQTTLELLNTQRTAVARLFTTNTTNSSDWIEQSVSDTEFEEASEFGVPMSVRVSPSLLQLGYPFRWWDARKGFTWRFLAEVESGQLEAIHSAVLEADNRLVFRHVLGALLTKTTTLTRNINENNVSVYPLGRRRRRDAAELRGQVVRAWSRSLQDHQRRVRGDGPGLPDPQRHRARLRS